MDVPTMLREHELFVGHIKRRVLRLNFWNPMKKDQIRYLPEILVDV